VDETGRRDYGKDKSRSPCTLKCITYSLHHTSSAGKQAVTKTVRTFQNLSAEADFTAAGDVTPPPTPGVAAAPAAHTVGAVSAAPAGSGSPSLHIDIQVHISPDSSPEQIDKIFESMAKHLYKKNK